MPTTVPSFISLQTGQSFKLWQAATSVSDVPNPASIILLPPHPIDPETMYIRHNYSNTRPPRRACVPFVFCWSDRSERSSFSLFLGAMMGMDGKVFWHRFALHLRLDRGRLIRRNCETVTQAHGLTVAKRSVFLPPHTPFPRALQSTPIKRVCMCACGGIYYPIFQNNNKTTPPTHHHSENIEITIKQCAQQHHYHCVWCWQMLGKKAPRTHFIQKGPQTRTNTYGACAGMCGSLTSTNPPAVSLVLVWKIFKLKFNRFFVPWRVARPSNFHPSQLLCAYPCWGGGSKAPLSHQH